MMIKQDEIAFAKQINDFEAAVVKDLNHRSSEVAKKWEFDFSVELPTFSKKLSWDQVSNDSMQLTRPKLQLKPKMSISAVNMKENPFTTHIIQNNEQNLFGACAFS